MTQAVAAWQLLPTDRGEGSRHSEEVLSCVHGSALFSKRLITGESLDSRPPPPQNNEVVPVLVE